MPRGTKTTSRATLLRRALRVSDGHPWQRLVTDREGLTHEVPIATEYPWRTLCGKGELNGPLWQVEQYGAPIVSCIGCLNADWEV